MQLLLEGAWLGLSAAVAPGPFQAYLLAQSVRNGAARTLPVAGVPLVTDPPVIAVVLLVLAQVPAGLVRALGVGALRAAAAPPATAGERAPPAGVFRAMLVNFTNPNVWIWWSGAAGPTLVGAWRESAWSAAAFLAGFYVLLVGGSALLVVLASRLARAGPGLARGLGALSGAALVLFGAWRLGRSLLGA